MRCLRLSALVTLWSLAVVPVSIVYAAAAGETGVQQPAGAPNTDQRVGGGEHAQLTETVSANDTRAGDKDTKAEGKAQKPKGGETAVEASFSVCSLGMITTAGILVSVM
ncbi:hypothetical protein BgAZ_207310 [Babesia gibsoni]|uniref:12 kDa protein n=1 Tax=Babesia gibsoni TaxID=33632 RepID=A0AAD8PEG5_BABGI|nr:hypothetical protein BgAZ_207310 [Babesia gibsoni]